MRTRCWQPRTWRFVASGTVTVQAALHECPMVVVYRLSPLTYRLGKPFVQVDTYAMANLVAGRRVVPELMQDDFTPGACRRRSAASADRSRACGGRAARSARGARTARRARREPPRRRSGHRDRAGISHQRDSTARGYAARDSTTSASSSSRLAIRVSRASVSRGCFARVSRLGLATRCGLRFIEPLRLRDLRVHCSDAPIHCCPRVVAVCARAARDRAAARRVP